MPAEKIATTFVDNGTETHTNVLRIQWGKFGGMPDAPDGWVNQGYAMLTIEQGSERNAEYYVELDPSEMDHLIRTLKRVRRTTFAKRKN